MTRQIPAGLVAAGMLAFGVAVGAQSTQPPAQTPAGTKAPADQPVTITGCVQSEADYRSAHDAGKGGVAGTGAGVANEFVLVEATAPSAGGRTTEPAGATGTAGSTAAGTMAYELTGSNEGQLSQYVGKRVEITGKLKAADTDAAGRPTGGATAGKPPSGVDLAGKDLKLRELDVVSVREVSGTCSTIKK